MHGRDHSNEEEAANIRSCRTEPDYEKLNHMESFLYFQALLGAIQ